MAGSSPHTPIPYDAGSSVAGAIIEHPTLGYLLQLRDARAPSFPLHWGLFGGHMEPGEAPLAALWRELAEELQLTPAQARRCRPVQSVARAYGGHMYLFHVLTDATTEQMVLGEGKAMRYIPTPKLAAALQQPGRSVFGHQIIPTIAQALRDHLAGRRDLFSEEHFSIGEKK